MKLKKRKPVGRTGQRSTLVIYIDCDNEDFDWLRRKIMPVVEEEVDKTISSMIWLEGEVVLSWQRASDREEALADVAPPASPSGKRCIPSL